MQVQHHGRRLSSVQKIVQDIDQRLKEISSRQFSLESDIKTAADIRRNGSGHLLPVEAPDTLEKSNNDNKEFALTLVEAISRKSDLNSYRMYLTVACGFCILGGFAIGVLMPNNRRR